MHSCQNVCVQLSIIQALSQEAVFFLNGKEETFFEKCDFKEPYVTWIAAVPVYEVMVLLISSLEKINDLFEPRHFLVSAYFMFRKTYDHHHYRHRPIIMNEHSYKKDH